MLVLSCIIPSAYAIDQLNITGFIDQSIIKTDNGIKLSGDSDSKYGSIERFQIGSSVSYEYDKNVDIRGMASYIKDGNIDGQVRLNYGLLDIHSDDGLYGVRVGRYCYGYGFYGASKNNPTYSDMALPPQGIYKDGLRYMTRSGDGVQVYTKTHLSQNYSAEFEIGYGVPILYPQQDIVQTFVLDKNVGTFTNESRVVSFNSTFNNRENGWVVKYDFLLLDYKFSSPIIDGGESFSVRPKNHYLGVRKYFEFGDLTIEQVWTNIGRTNIDTYLSPQNYQWAGSFGTNITYKHYLTDTISLIFGYDTWHANTKDKDGKKLATMTGNQVTGGSIFHESMNLGVSYRAPNYTAKAEIHHVNGLNAVRADGNNMLSPSAPTKYNILILSMTYKF